MLDSDMEEEAEDRDAVSSELLEEKVEPTQSIVEPEDEPEECGVEAVDARVVYVLVEEVAMV
jgi:hypothetical protein